MIKYHNLSSAIATSYFIFLIRATRCNESDLERVSSILLWCLPLFVSVFIFAFQRVAFEFRMFLARREILPGKHTIYKISGRKTSLKSIGMFHGARDMFFK